MAQLFTMKKFHQHGMKRSDYAAWIRRLEHEVAGSVPVPAVLQDPERATAVTADVERRMVEASEMRRRAAEQHREKERLEHERYARLAGRHLLSEVELRRHHTYNGREDDLTMAEMRAAGVVDIQVPVIDRF